MVGLQSINAQVLTSDPEEELATRDEFGRVRISEAQSLFDGQLTYDLQPLLFDTITEGGTIVHDTTNRAAKFTFSNADSADIVYMQTYEHFRYQPGKSQLINMTFNLYGGSTGVTKFVGYSNGRNGIEFIIQDSIPAIRLFTGTDRGDTIVTQGNWNLLQEEVTNRGITLDFTKTQILVIDFQALYVGRIRVGFNIDGNTYYVHQFNHANIFSDPYIQTANLPLRVGMEATSNVVTDSLMFVCAAVMSEAGQEENYAFQFSASESVSVVDGVDSLLISIQPKTTFNGKTNRTKLEIVGVSFMNTGNNPAIYKLVLGQSVTSPNVTDVNTTYSATQYESGGTLSGSPEIVFDPGYIPSSNQVKGSASIFREIKYPITLDARGNQRDLGKISILVQGVGGPTTVYGTIIFKEIR